MKSEEKYCLGYTMTKKYNGSVLIWFICFLILISSIVMIKLEDIYRKNQTFELELNGFKVEQEMYSMMLYYFEDYKEKILKNTFENINWKGIESLDVRGYQPKTLTNEKISVRDITILDSHVNCKMVYHSMNTLIDSYFTIQTVNKIFTTCGDKAIDNNSDNTFQNEKNRLINQALESLEPYHNDSAMNIIELGPGDNYIRIENLKIIVTNEGRIVQKVPFTKTTYIIGPNPNTDIYFELRDSFEFDRLYIFNNGNINSEHLNFNGFICIKSGNLYVNEITGSGRIIIDGYLQAIDQNKVSLDSFDIANKFALINKVFADPRIINYKR